MEPPDHTLFRPSSAIHPTFLGMVQEGVRDQAEDVSPDGMQPIVRVQ